MEQQTKTVNSAEFRQQMTAIFDEVENGTIIIITHFGRRRAVLIPPRHLAEIEQLLARRVSPPTTYSEGG